MLVHGEPQRPQRIEVHQQVVDHHARIAEAFDEHVGQHHAVHAPEGVVGHEEVAPRGVEPLEPLGRVGHAPLAEAGADELLRRQIAVSRKYVVDLRFAHITAQRVDDAAGHTAREARSLAREDGSDIDSRHLLRCEIYLVQI